MSTRSSIAVQHADGSVDAIYCHFDGYLDGVGKHLLASHDSLGEAESLVALGDLSTVCNDVRAYHRDRGEEWSTVAPKHYATLPDYLRHAPEDIGDNGYRYIYREGAWLVWGSPSADPIPVRNAVEAP